MTDFIIDGVSVCVADGKTEDDARDLLNSIKAGGFPELPMNIHDIRHDRKVLFQECAHFFNGAYPLSDDERAQVDIWGKALRDITEDLPKDGSPIETDVQWPAIPDIPALRADIALLGLKYAYQ